MHPKHMDAPATCEAHQSSSAFPVPPPTFCLILLSFCLLLPFVMFFFVLAVISMLLHGAGTDATETKFLCLCAILLYMVQVARES